MKIKTTKVCWFLGSVTAPIFIAYDSFADPMKYLASIDLLATILSVMVGISLAIAALLTMPNMSNLKAPDAEKERIKKILKQDDKKVIFGQSFLFYCYYLSLVLAVIIKISAFGTTTVQDLNLWCKALISIFVYLSSFALLWSATLPSLFKELREQRDSLG